MALIDDKEDAYVVRVVYDGPPFAGKTTTLQALAGELSGQLETPHEHEGRTLYFDWLDYAAGRFEGRPVRCQVIGVPGQKSLAHRRTKLLQYADAIVFVADTGSHGVGLSLKYAADLVEQRKGMSEPHPGIVVQANKRDVDDALPMAQVAARLRSSGIEAVLIESIASTGRGVREAFLFGLRLALDRVRALGARGMLSKGPPEIDSAEDLLRTLGGPPPERNVRPQASAPRAPVPPRPSEYALESIETAVAMEQLVASHSAGAAQQENIALPSPLVPSGCIWPAVEGRVIVQQAVAASGLTFLRRPPEDIYAYSPNGWWIHSRARDVFKDHNAARAALLRWARSHTRNEGLVSGKRCIAASPHEDIWRLWQIVGDGGSLAQQLRTELAGPFSGRAVNALLAAARSLVDAAEAFKLATLELPVALTTVTIEAGIPKFIGLMPGSDREAEGSTPRGTPDSVALVGERMRRVVADYARRVGPDRLISLLELAGDRHEANKPLAQVLIAAARRGV